MHRRKYRMGETMVVAIHVNTEKYLHYLNTSLKCANILQLQKTKQNKNPQALPQDCIYRNILSTPSKVITPPEYYVQGWALYFKKDIDKLGHVQRSATKTIDWKQKLMRNSWQYGICLAYRRENCRKT